MNLDIFKLEQSLENKDIQTLNTHFLILISRANDQDDICKKC